MLSFRIGWFDVLTVQKILKNLLQQHSSKAPIFLFLKFSATLLEIQCFQFFQISRFIILIVSWKSFVIIVFFSEPLLSHQAKETMCVGLYPAVFLSHSVYTCTCLSLEASTWGFFLLPLLFNLEKALWFMARNLTYVFYSVEVRRPITIAECDA